MPPRSARRAPPGLPTSVTFDYADGIDPNPRATLPTDLSNSDRNGRVKYPRHTADATARPVRRGRIQKPARSRHRTRGGSKGGRRQGSLRLHTDIARGSAIPAIRSQDESLF